MILGTRIKEEREKHSMTQNELARELNVSRQAISKWELGTAYPDIERLIQISDFFNVSLDSLIKGDQNLKQSIIIDDHSSSDFWYFMNRKGWILAIIIIFFLWMMVVVAFG
ncbi:hypothetical protein WR164_13160 [Philodulcilactobacillus myokoensis]|uniref:HTH cro/C1-type domain-containing protein n=1 Tax=Philodulcilactobacillus myokoensis TaxID=2929573 RepID=A0A9W6B1V9_9LACO|nr:helix-turn-helix transcriptional regulator [Philodulcilactobacillus myokoensis]GLB47337.1 hypothetical protein WR164_13160 [Philodulcilactobacillus myokoensis]